LAPVFSHQPFFWQVISLIALQFCCSILIACRYSSVLRLQVFFTTRHIIYYSSSKVTKWSSEEDLDTRKTFDLITKRSSKENLITTKSISSKWNPEAATLAWRRTAHGRGPQRRRRHLHPNGKTAWCVGWRRDLRACRGHAHQRPKDFVVATVTGDWRKSSNQDPRGWWRYRINTRGEVAEL
jgi:hypothetical protein